MSLTDFLPSLPSIPGLSSLPLGPLSDLLGGGGGDGGPPVGPIFTQLPKEQQALTTKYADPSLTSALGSIPPFISNAMQQYDLARVQKGQMPLTTPQTFGALQTAASGVPATPAPSQSLWQRAQSDIGDIVSSIPKLPFNLFSEATQLPEAPQALSQALGQGSLGGVLGGLAQVPGLRMVPGVNTLATLATQGPGGLLQHPILNALDVLPYAEPVVGGLVESSLSQLPAVQAAREAGDLEDINASRMAKGLQPVPDQSALTLAAADHPGFQWFVNTPLGRAVGNTFGPNARDLMQLSTGTETKYNLYGDPNADITVPPEYQPLRDAIDYANQWADQIPEARRQELTQAMALDRNVALNLPNVTDAEQAFVDGYVHHVDEQANYAINQGNQATVDGEVFTPQQANQIFNARNKVARYQAVSDARDLLGQATPATADLTAEGINPANFMGDHLTTANQLDMAEAYARAWQAAGNNAEPMLAAVRDARNPATGAVDMNAVKGIFDNELANPTPLGRQQYTPDEVYAELAPHQGRLVSGTGDTMVGATRKLIDAGNLSDAVDSMRGIANRSTYVVPNSDEMLLSLRDARDAQKLYDRIGKQYNERTLAQRQKISDYIEQRNVPARWTPQIQARVQNLLLDKYATDPAALQLIHDHLYTMLPDLGADELNQMYRGVASGWKNLRDQGLNPAYVAQISPKELPYLGRVNLSDVIRTPQDLQKRTFDSTPYVNDATVAMKAQSMHYLQAAAIDEHVNNLRDLYGVTTRDLQERYLPRARQAAELQPGLDVRAHLENLMEASHARYDPEGIFGHQAGKLGLLTGRDDLWLPKGIDQTLRKQFHEYTQNPISRLTNPVMKVFRTALVPLSVRSFAHHFLGNGVMMAGETDPGVFFRNWAGAKDLINSGRYDEIPGMPPSGAGVSPSEESLVEWAKTATKTDRLLAAHQYSVGQWLRNNVWNNLGSVRDAASNGINKIYQVREDMDQMSRAIMYQEGYNKALKLNPDFTEAQAQQAGVALVRKTLNNWDRYTPMERSVIKQVFPFYGFMNHTLRYAFRYPMDHPYRTAVLANFARNEVNDFGKGLPTQLMDALFLGHPDKNGNVRTANLGLINPFREVSNYFTIAGFTGAANPLITTALRAMGVDPLKGSTNLYSDVAYDPRTGQLRPNNPNLLSAFTENLIPQSKIITAMLGHNDQFKQLLQANPDAAGAYLRSSINFPNLFQNVNVPQAEFKAEVNRQQLQTQVRNKALRTGNWDEAMKYPGLRPLFAQLQQVMQQNPQVLKAYQAQVKSQSAASALPAALTTENLPGG